MEHLRCKNPEMAFKAKPNAEDGQQDKQYREVVFGQPLSIAMLSLNPAIDQTARVPNCTTGRVLSDPYPTSTRLGV